MTMIPDLLKELVKISARQRYGDNTDSKMLRDGEGLTKDKNIMHPSEGPMRFPPPSDTVMDDNGSFSLDQTPFKGLGEMLKKSRADNNTGPGVLRQLLSSVLGGGIVSGTGTVGGDPAGVSGSTHTPGTRQDAALNPTPMKDQPQPSFQLPSSIPQPRLDYSQPSALDPIAIEQLRQSLLTDSGQLDPNNPNGLSGRMNDPNSQVDMNNQRKESQTIEDSVRGFDGSRKANIQKGNL